LTKGIGIAPTSASCRGTWDVDAAFSWAANLAITHIQNLKPHLFSDLLVHTLINLSHFCNPPLAIAMGQRH
jgi:hypothetical protein